MSNLSWHSASQCLGSTYVEKKIQTGVALSGYAHAIQNLLLIKLARLTSISDIELLERKKLLKLFKELYAALLTQHINEECVLLMHLRLHLKSHLLRKLPFATLKKCITNFRVFKTMRKYYINTFSLGSVTWASTE